MTAGYSHTCALDTAGKVYCWGFNSSGQLGDNSTTNSLTPVAVNVTAGTAAMNGRTITQVVATTEHTCALDTLGQVYCWGQNGTGQLGDNSTTNRFTPVAVNVTAGTAAMSGKTITQITAGYHHTCALDTAGQVYCWGQNDNGQLGDNSTTDSLIPVAVNVTAGTAAMNGKTITQITANNSHTCALDTAGKVYCWGYNGYGKLGDNSTAQRTTPVAVNTTAGTAAMNNKTIIQIVADLESTCALDTAGQVYCWGNNTFGQLGDNSTTHHSTPVAVNTTAGTAAMNGKTIVQIAASNYHACALDSTDQVYCWGWNNYGQLGDNSTTNGLTPVAVNTAVGSAIMDGKAISQITTGGYYSCALGTVGQVYCWGRNNNGQLGDNSTTDSLTSVCVHTIYDGTGSKLPGLGCGAYELTVVMDADGTPAPCINVVIAADGLSLACTTTTHVAGMVDVTVDDGISPQALASGYEYVEEDGGGALIKKILSPSTGVGKIISLAVLGEIVFVAVGVAVFFKLKEV